MQSSNGVTSSNRAIVELTLGGLMLSLSALAVAFAHIGAGGAGFYRMLIASVLFYLLLRVRRQPARLAHPRARRYTALAGVFLAIDLILWHHSIYIVGPGIGSILTNCQVFFMTLLGLCLLKEKPSLYFVASISLAFVGLYLLLLPEMGSALGIQGVVYGVLSGLAYAVCVYYLKVTTQLPQGGGDKIAQMLHLSLWAAGVMLGYALLRGEPGHRRPADLLHAGDLWRAGAVRRLVAGQPLDWCHQPRAGRADPAAGAGDHLLHRRGVSGQGQFGHADHRGAGDGAGGVHWLDKAAEQGPGAERAGLTRRSRSCCLSTCRGGA